MDQRSDYSINHFNDSNFNMFLPDFMPESDFDNIIGAIGGDSTAQPVETFCLDYEYNQFTDSCTRLPVAPPVYGGNAAVFGGGGGTEVGGYGAMDPMSNLIWTRDVEEVKGSEGFDEDDSSDNTTTGEPEKVRRRSGGGVNGDRTKTLISERKRRSGMKEKLYALRSLVPNITKMDKASIVGDAARYIQDLQTRARNLRSDIATIEAAKNQKMSSQNSTTHQVSNSFPASKNISKFDIFQVDEKGYYVRLVCNKGRGVAASLHKALESIASFHVQSSNLVTDGVNFVLTFTLNVTTRGFDINLPNLKLWLSSAFLNEGFKFNTFQSA